MESSELNPKVSVIIQKIEKKWKKKFFYTTDLASVNTERNVRKNKFQMNVKTLIARGQKPVTKGTQKGAECMIWESVYIKVNVPINTKNCSKTKKN